MLQFTGRSPVQLLEQPSQAGEHERCDVVAEPHDYAASHRDSGSKPVTAAVLRDLVGHSRIGILRPGPAKRAPAQNCNVHALHGLRTAFAHTSVQPHDAAGARQRHPGGKLYGYRHRDLGQRREESNHQLVGSVKFEGKEKGRPHGRRFFLPRTGT